MQPWLERWQGHPERVGRDVVILVCAFAVLFSVAWSFLNYHQNRPVARRQRSVVDTFTMLLFFAGFSFLLGRQIGVLTRVPPAVAGFALFLGLAVVVLGSVVNVLGRHYLGATWSNQISIYRDQRLLTGGLFAWVRHPLYASTIWMFLGAGLAYLNAAAVLATVLIFIPAMWYRARQEERLLTGAFPEYETYRRNTGAFFPRFRTTKGNTP